MLLLLVDQREGGGQSFRLFGHATLLFEYLIYVYPHYNTTGFIDEKHRQVRPTTTIHPSAYSSPSPTLISIISNSVSDTLLYLNLPIPRREAGDCYNCTYLYNHTYLYLVIILELGGNDRHHHHHHLRPCPCNFRGVHFTYKSDEL